MSENAAPVIELIDADIPRARTAAPAVVVEGVHWTIRQGEFWAVGASPGGGKTDLLITAAALQRPRRGRQQIFGRDTRQMDENELVACHQKVAMVFDSGRLFPGLTVAENLALPLAYHLGAHRKEVTDRVEAILEMTHLQAYRDRLPGQMTRNLHQRVGLARALVLSPEVLLVDSPLLGVDPRQSRWWLEFLCALNRGHELFGKRPLTVVVTADDFRPWAETARQFAILKEGRFEVIGGREEVRSTREKVVQELLTPAFEV